MHKLSYKELQKYISEILDCDAFELHTNVSALLLEPQNGSFLNRILPSEAAARDFYIPYMMNDALECFLLLKNSRITGKYLADFKGKTSAEFIEKTENASDTCAVIFRQGTDNVFTVWFEEAYLILNCYRYDQIGHFWVKGAEHWRRLVYIIGTMYDKYEYMGEQVCNKEEISLLPLMEFAPFRMYSPIRESLDAYYSESPDGLYCMTELAKEVHDKNFLRLLRLYQLLPTNFMRKILFQAMNQPGRQKLYELIFQKVQYASIHYPERNYSLELNEEISAARSRVTAKLRQQGFSGQYPLFQKENLQVLAMEEHPFTILDTKEFSFRIQFMVSETTGDHSLSAGFFQKKGRRGWISTSLDF